MREKFRGDASPKKNEATESREKLERIFSEKKFDFGCTKESTVDPSLPRIGAEVRMNSGEYEFIGFSFNPDNPHKWNLIGVDLKDEEIPQPTEEVMQEAIYEFQSERPISRRAVEIGIRPDEHRADLAFYFAIATGNKNAIDALHLSDPRTRRVSSRKFTPSSFSSRYGGETWNTGGGSSETVSEDIHYVTSLRGAKLSGGVSEIMLENPEDINLSIQNFFTTRFLDTLASLRYDNSISQRGEDENFGKLITELDQLLNESSKVQWYADGPGLDETLSTETQDMLLSHLAYKFPDDEERERDIKTGETFLEHGIPSKLDVLNSVSSKDVDVFFEELEYQKKYSAVTKANPRKFLDGLKQLSQKIDEKIKDLEVDMREVNVEVELDEATRKEMVDEIRDTARRVEVILGKPQLDEFEGISGDSLTKMREVSTEAFRVARNKMGTTDVNLQVSLSAVRNIERQLRDVDPDRYDRLTKRHRDWESPESLQFLALSENQRNVEGAVSVRKGKMYIDGDREVDSLGRYRLDQDRLSTTLTRYTNSGKPDYPSFNLSNGDYVLFKKAFENLPPETKTSSELWRVEWDRDFNLPLMIVGPVFAEGQDVIQETDQERWEREERERMREEKWKQRAIEEESKLKKRREQEVKARVMHEKYLTSTTRSVLTRDLLSPVENDEAGAQLDVLIGQLDLLMALHPSEKVSDLKGVIVKRKSLLGNTSKKKLEKEIRKFETSISEQLQKIKPNSGWAEDWKERVGVVFGQIIPSIESAGIDISEYKKDIKEFIEEVVVDPDNNEEDLRDMIIELYS